MLPGPFTTHVRIELGQVPAGTTLQPVVGFRYIGFLTSFALSPNSPFPPPSPCYHQLRSSGRDHYIADVERLRKPHLGALEIQPRKKHNGKVRQSDFQSHITSTQWKRPGIARPSHATIRHISSNMCHSSLLEEADPNAKINGHERSYRHRRR